MITLYRGDDTGGQLGKEIKIVFHCDDAVDMDGVTVRFNLLNVITKEWTNVHDGDILEMFVTHDQSGRLPLGFLFGKIWGEDSSGKVRTFANRLPIIVTHDLRKVYGSDGLDSQDIHVYSSVDWDAIANKPTLFPSKVDMVEGLEEALKKAGSVKTVNNVGPDDNGNIAINAKSVGAVSGFVKETGVVIPVPEDTGLIIKGKGENYPFVFLEREDGSSVALVDNEQLEESIDTHNKNTFAHSEKFAKYAPKTTVYTKSEVDDKINQFAAHYLTADAEGSAFATVSALEGADEYFYAGEAVNPTKNDYAIVLNDDGKTARWAFFGEGEDGVWQRQYYISSTSFTDDQWAAINSGIKDYLVPKVLTVDESTATKKIVLGDKTFTSFSELTELVQNGVTRLKYYVTNASSRPVLYTAHLCDDSAIRFDATGTLGDAVYTRSIAITKTGADGIAVSVGTLTPMAKASELDGKLDKVVEEGSTTVSFDTVNSSGVTIYDEEQGVWTYIVLGYINFSTYLDLKPGDDYRSLELYNSEDGGFIGRLAFTSDIADATKLTPVYEWMDNGEGVIPDGVMVRNVGRPYSDDVPDPYNNATWHIDFEISTDGGQYWDSATYDDSYGASVGELNFGGFFCFTRMVDHYTTAKGESILAGTKTALFAGAVIKSESTELTNMACSVVPFADGMMITFAASTGLRQCEVLITGCTEGAALNVTATKLRGDADALTLEAGDNHLTFAEYATGEFFVTRHLANEIA